MLFRDRKLPPENLKDKSGPSGGWEVGSRETLAFYYICPRVLFDFLKLYECTALI